MKITRTIHDVEIELDARTIIEAIEGGCVIDHVYLLSMLLAMLLKSDRLSQLQDMAGEESCEKVRVQLAAFYDRWTRDPEGRNA